MNSIKSLKEKIRLLKMKMILLGEDEKDMEDLRKLQLRYDNIVNDRKDFIYR